MAALVLAASAFAGRISSSPYVFAASDVQQVVPLLKAAMLKQFGKAGHFEASCHGAYPGLHGGMRGYHEIHCSFSFVLLNSVGKSGSVIYWIDSHKKPQDKITWD